MQKPKMKRFSSPWLLTAAFVACVLTLVEILMGFQQAEAFSDLARSAKWVANRLTLSSYQDWDSIRSSVVCHEPENGQPEQLVCIYENLILFNGKLLYLTDNATEQLPKVKISWLKKFEGDDMLHLDLLDPNLLPWNWTDASPVLVEQAGLFHQSHYSNFYHMFSEVAPTVHHILCEWLQDCQYSPTGGTQLFWIQDRRPNIPAYIMLDSILDTFKCLSPYPVLFKDDSTLSGKPVILQRAIAGVPPDVRVFHNWEDDLKANWREPPKESMIKYRRRIADCFGFDFQQNIAATNPLRILFINRHYEEGRNVLNAHKLAYNIQNMPELAAFPSVELKVHYLEGSESIRYQAELFWNASLLIWPHGATMAHTFFLPRKAEAIEIIPWSQEDKSNLPEWVAAIREAFSLDVNLHVVQNKDMNRQMFNLDKLMEYGEYTAMAPPEKIALLERGDCPPGIDPFLCPFWWNHWKISVNLDWKELLPAVRLALRRLKRLHERGMKGHGENHNRSLTAKPLPMSPSAHISENIFKLQPRKDEKTGIPLSSITCIYDDGKAEKRLCLLRDVFIFDGKIFYVAQFPQDVSIPEIQIAWEDWTLEKGLAGDKYLAVQVVTPGGLPFNMDTGDLEIEIVDRAALAHQVDSGNFYHLVSEVAPTFFANWCTQLGYCSYSDRTKYQLLFIQPDPRHEFGLPPPVKEVFDCFGEKPFRTITETNNTILHVRNGIVGIGPYLRAYERQEWTKHWTPPPDGVMTLWRHFLSECTGTGFSNAVAPTDVFRVTFVNRPYSSGRSFLNLPEVMDWMAGEYLPLQTLGRPHEVVTTTLRETQPIRDQINALKQTNLLIYPHGATMAHTIFLPKGAAVLEVIPWPNVTEPHGWLKSIQSQYELRDLIVDVMVNERRDNLVLNWHSLSKDPDWMQLTPHAKVALQENGTCPPPSSGLEGKCMFEWLHWKSELVLNKPQLARELNRVLKRLKATLVSSS